MLKDLSYLATEAKNKRKLYDNSEVILSSEFRDLFLHRFPDNKILFSEKTSVTYTSNGLSIIIPNQWFIISSFFVDYLSALFDYKNEINKVGFTEDQIKSFRKDGTLDEQSLEIVRTTYEPEDSDFLIKFLTDYEWWSGSKTIDRGDFFVSAVLNLANVVHATQGYIATLAQMFTKHKDLIPMLQNLVDNGSNSHIVLLQNNILRNVIFSSFKYVLENYGESLVLAGHEEKASTIDSREFTGLSLPKYFGFENIVGQFNTNQTDDQLKSSGTKRFMSEPIMILNNEFSYFTTQWNEGGERGLTLGNFNNYLAAVSNNRLEIIKENNNFRLVFKSTKPQNTIYFGPPGTGKSYAITSYLKEHGVASSHYSRITFHPDYDYSSFVGGYKPFTDDADDNKIKYRFVPQVFTDLYVQSWSKPEEHFYLVIEEINRGNCAEIFGDIFQLLDRNPEYNIQPSSELRNYLLDKEKEIKEKQGEDVKFLFEGKLQMPINLSILASMNTSDQSLFPMDSAFKRRWDWKYIPIDTECKASDFTIVVSKDHSYRWLAFLKNVNDRIYNVTRSADKQLGNWFIDATKNDKEISAEVFVNKVLFYLWNDVFKDETHHYESIFRYKNGEKEVEISYNNFFEKSNQLQLLEYLFEKTLGLENIKEEDDIDTAYIQQEVGLQVAEPDTDA